MAMKKPDQSFWPYQKSTSALLAVLLFVGLLILLAVVRFMYSWPTRDSAGAILVGIAAFSSFPLLLALVDLIIERGAVLKYAGFEIDFSKLESPAMAGITIEPIAGVPGQPVTDSSTTKILDALKAATSCNVAIIDLEDGEAWWETRLLVLLAGAERLKRPQKVVFVGTEGGRRQQFQGWAHPDELMKCLVRQNEQYQRSVLATRVAVRQWELVDPRNRIAGQPFPLPATPPWMTSSLAIGYPTMAFDQSTGLPNEFFAEQLLAAELGQEVESQTNIRGMSLVRMNELFQSVLIKDHLDESWPLDRQREAFFRDRDQHIAITKNKTYVTMLAKLDVIGEMVRKLAERTQT